MDGLAMKKSKRAMPRRIVEATSQEHPTDVLSHVSARNQARLVDVSNKTPTRRTAVAEAWVEVGETIATLLSEAGAVAKGNVLETARLAGIMAAKRTGELIPLCHPLPLEAIDVQAELMGTRVRLLAMVSTHARSGVEMEAMTAASVAALTVYDMVKAAGKGVSIGPVRLLEKRGGKSGVWRREELQNGQS